MCEKVGVVLVNYNGEKYIADCMDSLLKQTYTNIVILFWDNCSSDHSVKIVKEMYPQVYVMESRINYGFAKANNLAVRKLGQLEKGIDYFLLLNVDTAADPFFLESLLRKADSNTVTTAHICTGSHARSIWYAGGELQTDIGKSRHLYIRKQFKEVPVTFISGCCMLIHRNIIQQYGLFDPVYHMYYEDTDLCMRWYLHGVKMYYIPDAKLWHKVGGSIGGVTSPLKEYYMVRNRFYFISKYAGYIKISRKQLLYEILRYILENFMKCDWKIMKADWLGVTDFYRGRMGKMKHKI